MILHKYLLLLVQPDVVQPGWAVVKTLLPVSNWDQAYGRWCILYKVVGRLCLEVFV